LEVEDPWHELHAPVLMAELMYFGFAELPVTLTYIPVPKLTELLVKKLPLLLTVKVPSMVPAPLACVVNFTIAP
jgi:hypothetical protein